MWTLGDRCPSGRRWSWCSERRGTETAHSVASTCSCHDVAGGSSVLSPELRGVPAQPKGSLWPLPMIAGLRVSQGRQGAGRGRGAGAFRRAGEPVPPVRLCLVEHLLGLFTCAGTALPAPSKIVAGRAGGVNPVASSFLPPFNSLCVFFLLKNTTDFYKKF